MMLEVYTDKEIMAFVAVLEYQDELKKMYKQYMKVVFGVDV